MEKLIIRLLFLVLLSGLLQAGTVFDVSLWGVHVADVIMARSDTTVNQQRLVSVRFSSNTTPFSSRIYPVDSHYHMLVDPETYQLKYFTKDTQQPGVVNSIKTFQGSGGLTYEGTEVTIPDSAFTIFTLLDYLSQSMPGDGEQFLLEREGLFYHCEVQIMREDETSVNYRLLIDLKSDQLNEALFEKTDIFSWAVFRKGASRSITIDKNTHAISRCEFKYGLMKLIAIPRKE